LFAAGGKAFFITDGKPFNTAAFGVFEPVREENKRRRKTKIRKRGGVLCSRGYVFIDLTQRFRHLLTVFRTRC